MNRAGRKTRLFFYHFYVELPTWNKYQKEEKIKTLTF